MKNSLECYRSRNTESIKQMAQTLLFLQEKDIRGYEKLEEMASGSSARFNELSQTIKDAEK